MIKFLRKAKKSALKGTALVRLDFNSEDGWRMDSALPTLRFLESVADKVIVVSHRGRPQGIEKKLSLAADARKLSKLLGKPMRFFGNFSWGSIHVQVTNAPRGSLFMLENIRFLPGEEKNSIVLAKQLASLADYYVNDAFAVSHRANASLAAITDYLPSYGGFQMEREIKILGEVMQKPKKPLVIVLGGAKAGDKLGVMHYFKSRADSFLLAGTPANTILFLRGEQVGKSIRETNQKMLRALGPVANIKMLVLPIDAVWSGERMVDIGPGTLELFKEKIMNARTIIWNGPLGRFEEKKFAAGTKGLIELLAHAKARIIIGGGETVAAFHALSPKPLASPAGGYSLNPHLFISTGGGAMLDFLAGKKLPGIKALER